MSYSALWDHGTWDNPTTYWDRLYAEILAVWTSGNDSWAGNVRITNNIVGNWVSDDSVWSGSVKLYNQVSIDYSDDLDVWDVQVYITAPDVSVWIDQRDTWTSLIYVTLHPPIYSAGGGWWINVWGDRLPNWKERRKNLENAAANWRYKVQGAWTSEDSTWGGSIHLADISEERLQRQIKAMFGSHEVYDEDEDLLWLI